MTREERIAAQRRAHSLLGRLVDRCDREGLPVLHWSIAEHGLITARCLNDDHAERLGAFQAWTVALDLHLWPEDIRDDGRIRLQSARESFANDVDLTVVAFLDREARP